MWVCTEKFGAKQQKRGEMSAEGNPIVPVDVVQGIVQQLATVSQHTTTATTAMRHLVSEIAGLRDMRARDTTTMVEALALASVGSGSAGVVVGKVVRIQRIQRIQR